jgi:hypothetical protein
VRRRRRAPASPGTAAALATLDTYQAILETLAEAGDRWAPERLRGVAWTRREIRQWGLDFISELQVEGYAAETQRLLGAPSQNRD